MTAEQVSLVQSSFAKVVPILQAAAGLFYGRLFELDPALRPLFKGSIEEQGKKLMQVLGVAVASLDNIDAVLPTVRSLGARHQSYGVKERDYDTVGVALMWTLEKGLGDAFTPPVRDAWTDTYVLLSTVMKDSARNADTAAA